MQHEEMLIWFLFGFPILLTHLLSVVEARAHGDAKPRRKFLFKVPSCAARALRAPAIAWSVSKTVERNFDVCKFLCAFILTMRMQHEEFVDLSPVVVPDLTDLMRLLARSLRRKLRKQLRKQWAPGPGSGAQGPSLLLLCLCLAFTRKTFLQRLSSLRSQFPTM